MANFRIHVLDMGDTKYGDCLIVEAGNRRILIDGGHSNDFDGQDGYNSIPDQIRAILGEPPFRFDLLVVTHVHADHIGCLPQMFDAGMLKIGEALVADPDFGFGRTAGAPDLVADADLSPLERGLIAAGTEQDYSDLPADEIIQFLLDAAKLEDTYREFLKNLKQAVPATTIYVGQSMEALEKKFSNIGLKILGPTPDHLERCSEATVRAARANASRNRNPDAVMDEASAVAQYRRMFASRARADANPDDPQADFIRDGKNNTSIVLKLTVDGKSALLAGDMQFADAMIHGMEQDMLDIREVVRNEGPYVLVKTSHHTSFNGLSDEVLGDYPGTKLFVHSGGRRDPDHPDKDGIAVLRRVKDQIQFARTDRNGKITILLSPGEPRFELSQGKLNVFTLNPKNVRDEPGALALVPSAPTSIEQQPVIQSKTTSGDRVEVVARVPFQRATVTLTIDVQPKPDVVAPGDKRVAPPPIPRQPANRLSGPDFSLGGGRVLPKLLFVTQTEKLERNIGKDEANGIFASLQKAGVDLLDLPANTVDPNEAIAQVRKKLPGDYKGVVLIGGYDVVPPRRLDTIGDAIRARLNAIPDMQGDPDDFIVWNDDGFVDTDEDGQPDLPVSRIPDGMIASLMRASLQATLANGASKFGIRNLKRPFAEMVWSGIGGKESLLTSSPTTFDSLQPAQLKTSKIYLMLHGESSTGKWFLGESNAGDFPKAIDASAVTDVAGAVVFAGCCWGALCGERLAIDPGPPVARALGNSLAMQFLLAGANAFVGSTGVHYSPGPGEKNAGQPMHEAFWAALAAGNRPAEALFQAKKKYFQRFGTARMPVALAAIERKIFGEFTCLGLGW
jgi:beta-lactamase superfamily II metal-dependent hydrolase